MRKFIAILKHSLVLAALSTASLAAAQQPPLKSPLLDHLVGKWELQGPMAGRDALHDVDAEWVLDHHYVQIHEVSRRQDSKGKPDYQATIYIAWNEAARQFAALWLDDYGGLASESIGVADPKPNELHFIFKDGKGVVVFSNDFIYDEKTDTWEWHLDNIVEGAAQTFGRVKLSRR